MAVTKLVERCFISDLALVSSPGVACGFRYDSNHREEEFNRALMRTEELRSSGTKMNGIKVIFLGGIFQFSLHGSFHLRTFQTNWYQVKSVYGRCKYVMYDIHDDAN